MNGPETIAKGVTLYSGDCLNVLDEIAAGSVDSCVTDPPYHLTMAKRLAGSNSDDVEKNFTKTIAGQGANPFQAAARGFMGKAWDGGDLAFKPELWAKVLRSLKPGGHLIAFSGTRTYHRMACAIEDAGFEIRDQLAWVYGQGFPKSLDVSKAIDRAAGAEREIVGPKANLHSRGNHEMGEGWQRPWMQDAEAVARGMMETAPATDAARQWEGWGTALKPAWEPIVLARKPLVGTVAANVLAHGTGALNIDGCRIDLSAGEGANERQGEQSQESRYTNEGGTNFAAQPGRRIGSPGWGGPNKRLSGAPGQEGKLVPRTPPVNGGRWPANLMHDGSDDVVAVFPDSDHARGNIGEAKGGGGMYGHGPCLNDFGAGDAGSAARFFYTAKADADDRLGSKHPTVKPVDLMQWLVRLVTPPGGLVLDLFAGTGTTAEAAFRQGFRCTLIEREAEYQADIRRRMALVLAGPDERARESIKAKIAGKPIDHGPLFAGVDVP